MPAGLRVVGEIESCDQRRDVRYVEKMTSRKRRVVHVWEKYAIVVGYGVVVRSVQQPREPVLCIALQRTFYAAILVDSQALDTGMSEDRFTTAEQREEQM